MSTILNALLFFVSSLHRLGCYRTRLLKGALRFYITRAHRFGKSLHERDGRRIQAFKKKLLRDKEQLSAMISASDQPAYTVKEFARVYGVRRSAIALAVLIRPITKLSLLWLARSAEDSFGRLQLGVTGATIASVGVALSIMDTTIRNEGSRSRSLHDILSRRQSALFGYELVLWICNKSSHIEDVIGDFRETYESRMSKRGEVAAMAWAREQILHEVVHRIKWVIGVAGSAQKVAHWFRGHLG